MSTVTSLGIQVPDATDSFPSSIGSFQSAFATINALITSDRARITTNEAKLGGGTPVQSASAVTQALIAKGFAAQTANIIEVRNSSDVVLSAINNLGDALIDQTGNGNGSAIGGAPLTSTRLAIYSVVAGAKTLVLRGAASQSANIQEWQNSSGTALLQVEPAGILRLNNVGNTWGVSYLNFNPGTATTNNLLVAARADSTPLDLVGATSQTANILQIRSSSGTVLSGIMSTGAPYFDATLATTTATTGAASALPATPGGYITVNVAGNSRKIPYYGP